jgi:nucleotide-binding universal stress UspA family protein
MNDVTTMTDTRGLETVLLAVGNRDDTRVDALVDAVREVAVPTDATVVIAHVFDSNSYREAVGQILEAPDEDIDPDELAAQMSVTQEIMAELKADPVSTVPRATTGTSSGGIVSIAKDVSADRVIVGGRQRSPAGKAIFVSTAQEVMLNAPCPVTFVRDQ